VAIYEYRCDDDGVFDVTRPFGTAPETVACPVCGSDAKRVFSVGMLRCGTRPAVFAAIERSEKSAHEPEVVTSVPSAGAPPPRTRVVPLNPTLARLPRP
jgi:putative FmdB family regulatory protein